MEKKIEVKKEFVLGDYCLGIEEIRGIKVEET